MKQTDRESPWCAAQGSRACFSLFLFLLPLPLLPFLLLLLSSFSSSSYVISSSSLSSSSTLLRFSSLELSRENLSLSLSLFLSLSLSLSLFPSRENERANMQHDVSYNPANCIPLHQSRICTGSFIFSPLFSFNRINDTNNNNDNNIGEIVILRQFF